MKVACAVRSPSATQRGGAGSSSRRSAGEPVTESGTHGQGKLIGGTRREGILAPAKSGMHGQGKLVRGTRHAPALCARACTDKTSLSVAPGEKGFSHQRARTSRACPWHPVNTAETAVASGHAGTAGPEGQRGSGRR